MIMAGISASAPGKAILFGEHAVVYGQPAIAIPLLQLQSKVYITANPLGTPDEIWFSAPDIGLAQDYFQLPDGHAFKAVVDIIKGHFQVDSLPAMRIRVVSSIPVASGLGSGTSVTVSLLKAITTFLGHPLSEADVSRYTFEIEKIYHGHPSGIDNTVITYQKPIFYIRDLPVEQISIERGFSILLVDSGINSHTSDVVNDVRNRWQAATVEFESLFSAIGALTIQARQALATGDLPRLGSLMIDNHTLLAKLGVSHTNLDKIVDAAMTAGALGAKMSGAGRGGYAVVLSDQGHINQIRDTLSAIGFLKSFVCEIPANTIG